MANMTPKRNPMPEQRPDLRNRNFQEVSFGYTADLALDEAARCLHCKTHPCTEGCPVQVDIPGFIDKLAKRDFAGAYDTISATNSLPAVCGRVCPQESQCEAHCVRGIHGEPVAIGRLERFAADWRNRNQGKLEQHTPAPGAHRVAIVGSGPASLTCAGDLAKAGCDVTVFEAFHQFGGVLVYGIPEFRLPKQVVANEVERLAAAGVKFEKNMVIGRVVSIDELFEQGFEAVFIGTGAGLPMFLGIEGESLMGVYSANEYLTRVNLMKAYREEYDTPVVKSRNVAVVGGGNVAMDASRCALRMGAEKVYILYRRSTAELPARAEEVEHAVQEGVEFNVLANPVRIYGDRKGRVSAIECAEMELGEPDDSGRRRPVEKKGVPTFALAVDTVIVAVGTSPNPLIKSTTEGLETNSKGCIKVDEGMATSRPGVFAGGDAVTGAATVILAMGAGKTAAESILKYLKEK